jgi:DNA (cytosine-5)-methyltransferase 1
VPKNNQLSANPIGLDRILVDFFAGMGLMRLGLERHGWSIALANDIDEQKFQMYKGNFRDAEEHYLVKDIHQLSADEVPTSTLATASFPCNDLSLAGARNGLQGRHSSAFWGLIRILREMGSRRPPMVLLENVTGFLTSCEGKDFRDALLALNGLGYGVDAFILDAVSFVPQSRARLFVVGILNQEDPLREVPHPAALVSKVRPRALAEFIRAHSDIQWDIRMLPDPPETEDRLVDVVEDLPEDAPEWWSKERTEYLLNQMSSRHRRIADEMIRKRDWSYGTVFRRIRHEKSMAELRVDGIAGCLRTPCSGRVIAPRVRRISKSRQPKAPLIKRNYESIVFARKIDSGRIISFKVRL